jgi:DNA-binding transcriptional ArsR family regulator
MNKFLWELLVGTKGGINRARIIDELNNRPYNINQLAEKLNLDYKTVRHHIEVLEDNNMVISTGKKYGALYFLSDKMEENYDSFLKISEEFMRSNHQYAPVFNQAQ